MSRTQIFEPELNRAKNTIEKKLNLRTFRRFRIFRPVYLKSIAPNPHPAVIRLITFLSRPVSARLIFDFCKKSVFHGKIDSPTKQS